MSPSKRSYANPQPTSSRSARGVVRAQQDGRAAAARGRTRWACASWRWPAQSPTRGSWGQPGPAPVA